MENLWNAAEAQSLGDDFLKLRVYTSWLLGQNPSLVLHGGGNTSVKAQVKNIFGETEAMLYVKGSGWDLAALEPAGLVPVKLDALKKAVHLNVLSDTDMVCLQRAAMPNPLLPAPSVEAILHALIPFTYVDHTHADAVVTLTNSPDGERLVRGLYGPRVLIIPYIMPGFALAKKVYELTQSLDWKTLDGLVLLNHGIFTFSDDAKTSYERMLELVGKAETYLAQHAPVSITPVPAPELRLTDLAQLRQAVSTARGNAAIVRLLSDPMSLHFANHPRVLEMSQRGPLTPDHVIRTKPVPVILQDDPKTDVEQFSQNYRAYFNRHTPGSLTQLNPAPCWAVWPGRGILAFGATEKDARIIADIITHTVPAILAAEYLGGWKPVSEKDIFELEYWELEQAKLKTGGKRPEFQGKVVLVTGAVGGIGRACAEAFLAQGAAVAALDIDPAIQDSFKRPEVLELICDVTDRRALQSAVETTVRTFGGLDILVNNAGIFTKSEPLEFMDPAQWQRSLDVNLSGQQALLQLCIPYLRVGTDPAVVIIASKNVPAPGPGAGAYSVAKAGLTQLARVAALELAPSGIRVNVIHPNAVFDTKLWTPEVLEQRARHYGMSVQQYKTNNLLKVEVTSADVARLALALAGSVFSKTTGAQVPIDGGNDRVI
jgi:rhamnose utilization protein RhaD (predicted bifunctional aldolase and dehydrogenase)/NAD(P)-dependent dehydrogenase (short-subunit alcohol dehydrogenase family)